jgi:hypothetical protein
MDQLQMATGVPRLVGDHVVRAAAVAQTMLCERLLNGIARLSISRCHGHHARTHTNTHNCRAGRVESGGLSSHSYIDISKIWPDGGHPRVMVMMMSDDDGLLR